MPALLRMVSRAGAKASWDRGQGWGWGWGWDWDWGQGQGGDRLDGQHGLMDGTVSFSA